MNKYSDHTARNFLYIFDGPVMATCLVAMLATTGGVLVFRLWSNDKMGPTGGGIVGGLVQGIAIYVLNTLFEMVAFKLTNAENQRTQADWENSFVAKLFGFQFLNTYTGMIYIAFIKYAGGLYDLKVSILP